MNRLVQWLGLQVGQASLTRPAWLALLLIALLALSPGFTTIPTMDRDEARYSQASRQMLETGDFVDIRFQEQPRHVKPAGIYWLQSIAAMPFGGANAPQWAFRLPSLLGALFAVLATAWFGARLAARIGGNGARVGFAAGLLMALTLLVGIEARTAKTDAVLLLAATMAQIALYFIFHAAQGLQDRAVRGPFWGAPLIFWLASGVALMIKGPIVTMVSVSTILVLCLWRRDWRMLKQLHALKGLGVVLAIGLPWLLAIVIRTEGGFIEQSIGHALLGKVAQSDDSHGGPTGYHTIALLLTWWPAVLLIALTGVYAWRQRAASHIQFLLAWIIPTWLIFELVVTKLPHYILPVFPALAVLSAFALEDAGRLLASVRVRRLHYFILALFVVITMVLGVLPYYLADEINTGVPILAPFMIGISFLVCVCAVFFQIRPSLERLLPLAGMVILFYIGILGTIMPNLDKFWMSRSLEREVGLLQGCREIPLATLGYREPSAVFVFGTNTVLGENPSIIEHLVQYPECGLIVVTAKEQAGFLAAAEAKAVGLQAVGMAEGYNYVKGDELQVTLYAAEGTSLSR